MNNCKGFENSKGSLFIDDVNKQEFSNVFKINNNTFSNNYMNITGGIYIESSNKNSIFQFNNNLFISN